MTKRRTRRPRANALMRGFLRALAGAAAALAVSATSAFAEDLALAPMSDDELSGMRGGFISAAGVEFDLSAVLTTAIDGETVLRTEVRTGADGLQVQRDVAATLTALADGSFQLAGLGGHTTIMQSVDAAGIVNAALNTASDRAIRQDTIVYLTLPNFESFQAAIALDRVGLSLANDMRAISIGR